MNTFKLTETTLATKCVPNPKQERAYYWCTEQPGFGVSVSRSSGTKVFIVRGRDGAGELVKRTIGKAGQAGPDGHPWTVLLARRAARAALGELASGKTPATRAARREANGGPTLRDALDFHVGKMERGERRKGTPCSPRSIATLRGGIELHFADYLDRPLLALTADVLDSTREKIMRDAERVAGSNPKNPPGLAVSNRLFANVSAIWRSWDKRYDLPVACPVRRFQLPKIAARENRIANDELPSWYAKVMAIENHVRRDLQLVALFTGVRTDGVRNLAWDDVDFDDELIQIARAKGDRPYTVPMTKTVREVLERRQKENVALMKPYGGDHGFVFPSLARDAKVQSNGKKRFVVQAVAEVKERRTVYNDDDEAIGRETYLPGVQACRKTFNSIAMDIGISKEMREALMNHEGRGVNVKSYGFREDWSQLRACADQIEARLWACIRGEVKKQGRKAKLRAV